MNRGRGPTKQLCDMSMNLICGMLVKKASGTVDDNLFHERSRNTRSLYKANEGMLPLIDDFDTSKL